mmetsp:Transcript_36991/g.106304  ORF Transcript_36991/g.106304 Transcript_36991/m.106304 type:complete len:263 (-) Transcript_36991:130-918(-)
MAGDWSRSRSLSESSRRSRTGLRVVSPAMSQHFPTAWMACRRRVILQQGRSGFERSGKRERERSGVSSPIGLKPSSGALARWQGGRTGWASRCRLTGSRRQREWQVWSGPSSSRQICTAGSPPTPSSAASVSLPTPSAWRSSRAPRGGATSAATGWTVPSRPSGSRWSPWRWPRPATTRRSTRRGTRASLMPSARLTKGLNGASARHRRRPAPMPPRWASSACRMSAWPRSWRDSSQTWRRWRVGWCGPRQQRRMAPKHSTH